MHHSSGRAREWESQDPHPCKSRGRGTRPAGGTACNAAHDSVLWDIMATMKTVSFRINSEAVDSLDALAETMDRDRSYLLNEAIERYLELNEYHIKLIEKGLRAAKEGKLVSHAEVKKMIGKMGRQKTSE